MIVMTLFATRIATSRLKGAPTVLMKLGAESAGSPRTNALPHPVCYGTLASTSARAAMSNAAKPVPRDLYAVSAKKDSF